MVYRKAIKNDMDYNNLYEDTWKDKKDEWMDYVKKNMYFVLLPVMLDIENNGSFYRVWNEKYFNSNLPRMEIFKRVK